MAASQTQFEYPLRYLPTSAWRQRRIGIAAAVGVGGPLLAFNSTSGMTASLITVAAITIAVAVLGTLVRKRLILREDSVEIRGLTGTQMFSKSKVRGCTMFHYGRYEQMVCVLLLLHGRAGVMIESFELDEAFWAWMMSLPEGVSPVVGRRP